MSPTCLYSGGEGKDLLRISLARYTHRAQRDFRIICRDRAWDVHRLNLALQSEVFAAACIGNFKESASGTLDLPDDDPDEIDILVHYLYNLDYADRCPTDPEERLHLHITMCVLADKYDIPTLQSLAEEQLRSDIASAEVVEEVLADAALHAYDMSQSTEAIRTSIVGLVIDRGLHLLSEGEGDDRPIVQAMRACEDFAIDVTSAIRASSVNSAASKGRTLFRCPACAVVQLWKMVTPQTNRDGMFQCADCKAFKNGEAWLGW